MTRKKPFSGKQKKQQLALKRATKSAVQGESADVDPFSIPSAKPPSKAKGNGARGSGKRNNRNTGANGNNGNGGRGKSGGRKHRDALFDAGVHDSFDSHLRGGQSSNLESGPPRHGRARRGSDSAESGESGDSGGSGVSGDSGGRRGGKNAATVGGVLVRGSSGHRRGGRIGGADVGGGARGGAVVVFDGKHGRRKGRTRDAHARALERRLASRPVERRVSPGTSLPCLPLNECSKSEDPRDFCPMPIRPEWHRGMGKGQLEASEAKGVASWKRAMDAWGAAWLENEQVKEKEEKKKKEEETEKKKKAGNVGASSGTGANASANADADAGGAGAGQEGRIDDDGINSGDAVGVNWFEHNLETWRQLWRVCERSDVVVVVVDARFPLLLLSDALWDYVCGKLAKPIVLVLNKSDLVPGEVVDAWRSYLEDRYERLAVVPFRSPHIAFKGKRERTDEELVQVKGLLRVIGEQRITKDVPGDGGAKVVEASSFFDPSNRLTPGVGDARAEGDEGDEGGGGGGGSSSEPLDSEEHHLHHANGDEQRKRADSLMIGFVGNPNVGKSSLINTIFGRKRVSYSRTPGHTKHFQTLFLQRRVQVCDSPGVVFPGYGIPRALQVISGSYPIAQLRGQFEVVRYLAERCVPPLHVAYKLEHDPDALEDLGPGETLEWSPFSLCEALAEKKGFHTRGGAADVARAANYFLRAALNGDPPLVFVPPGWEGRILAPEDNSCDWVAARQAVFTARLGGGELTRGGGKGEFSDAFQARFGGAKPAASRRRARGKRAKDRALNHEPGDLGDSSDDDGEDDDDDDDGDDDDASFDGSGGDDEYDDDYDSNDDSGSNDGNDDKRVKKTGDDSSDSDSDDSESDSGGRAAVNPFALLGDA